MKPTAIFFDLGKVLVTFDWNIAIPRFAALNGGDDERIKRFLANPFHDAFERDEFSGDEFFRRGLELTGFQGTREQFEAYWNEIFHEIPSSARVLKKLAGQYPLYALSNTNPWHAAYLEATFDWMKLFNKRFYSFALKARKPDPRIYRAALERVGASPADVLFIDDRLENIESARELGFQTIHLTSPELLAPSLDKFGVMPEPL